MGLVFFWTFLSCILSLCHLVRNWECQLSLFFSGFRGIFVSEVCSYFCYLLKSLPRFGNIFWLSFSSLTSIRGAPSRPRLWQQTLVSFLGPCSLSLLVFVDLWPVVILPHSVLVSSSDSGRYSFHVSLTDWGKIIFYPCWLFFWHLNNWSSPSLRPLPFVVSLFSAHCFWFSIWLVWTTVGYQA